MLDQFNVILFDADRTLYDTGAMETYALEKLIPELGVDFTPEMACSYYEINEELWRRIELGELTREYVRVERFRRFLKMYGISADPEEVNERYITIFKTHNVMMPGAEQVCRTLAKEKTLAIVTNGTAHVQRARLAMSAITDCLTDVFISEEIGVPKPQKAFFEAVLESLHVTDRSRVLIVGDSLTGDIRGGNNAGIRTCWFNPDGAENHTDAHCDFEIAALTELLEM